MTSCSMKTYYQVVDVKSTNLQKESNNYVYNDGVCKVVYNFWEKGGNAGFSITNLSDEIIYLDLGNTFYIKNGIAYDYYRARTHGTGKNVKLVVAKSSLTNSMVTSSESNQEVSYIEKPVVAIPPHASKSFSEYEITTDVFQNCSVKMMVKKDQPDGITFSESEAPIHFQNYITYRKGENGEAKVVKNDFHISGFTNYLSKDIIVSKKYGCKQTAIKKIHKEYAPNRFFVIYNEKHPNHNSADAKATQEYQLY